MAPFFRSASSTTASRLSGLAAASLLAATYAAAPSSAGAVEGLPPHCAKAGNELAQLKCGTAYHRERRLDAEARSAEAKARGAAADKKTAASRTTKECNDGVTRDIQEASKAGPLTPSQVKAFESRIAGCDRS